MNDYERELMNKALDAQNVVITALRELIETQDSLIKKLQKEINELSGESIK